MASYFSTEPHLPENADDGLDPMKCPLHSQTITGSIDYTMNQDGEYPVGAPHCYCSLGINDAIQISSPKELAFDDEDEDKDDYFLPLENHFLPGEFKKLLRDHNLLIKKLTENRWTEADAIEKFKKVFPLDYNTFRNDCIRLTEIYPKEVQAVKD